jgi:hypothetical protein
MVLPGRFHTTKTHSGPSPKVVGTSMNGSKRSSAMPQSSATGEPSPPSEPMGSAPPRLWPAPQSKPYGFSSDLVVTASDQRMDAVPTATVTMTDTVPTATVTMRVRSIAPHQLH